LNKNFKISWVPTGSFPYWPTAELENQAKALLNPTGSLPIIVDSTVKKIQDQNLEL
jgi:hypothetical protein